MKFTKYFMAALVLSMGFASCTSEDEPNVGKAETKTVKLNVSGVFAGTRSQTTSITDNTPVKVNQFSIYLTDNTGTFRTAYNENNAEVAPTGFDFNSTSLNTSIAYHFVPAAVNHVIAIGNKDVSRSTYANEAAVDGKTLDIAAEQDCENLSLYAEENLTAAGTEELHQYPLYKATLNLKPRVSRLEISGFEYAGTKYKDMELKMVFFNNYYTEANLVTGKVNTSDSKTVAVSVDKTNVFTTLGNVTINTHGAWSFDKPTENENEWTFVDNKYTPLNPFAYNFFTTGTTLIPQVIVWLQAKSAVEGDSQDVQNLYLTTKNFYKEGDDTKTNAISKETNQVYTAVFKFDDTALENPEKCVDLTVKVANWEVVPVIPEFN